MVCNDTCHAVNLSSPSWLCIISILKRDSEIETKLVTLFHPALMPFVCRNETFSRIDRVYIPGVLEAFLIGRAAPSLLAAPNLPWDTPQ